MTNCPMCDAPAMGTAFCEKCGTRLAPAEPVAVPPPPPAVEPAAPLPPTPVAATPTSARAPKQRRAGGRPTTPVLVGAAVVTVLAIAGLGVGIGVAVGGGDDGPEAARPTVTATHATAVDDGELLNQPEEGPGVPATERATDTRQNECWDGTTVVTGDRCPRPTGPIALRYAFPQIDFTTCSPHGGGGTHFHHGWSYNCHWGGHEFHIAEYTDQAARRSRLAAYGPCGPPGADQCLAGPTTTNRYVRAYAEHTGLLFYVSSDEGRSAVSDLVPRAAAVMLTGRPVD